MLRRLTVVVVRWLRVILRRIRRPKLPSAPPHADDELTAQEKQANAWSRRGWVQVWTATTGNPDGRRLRYWVRAGGDGLLRLFPGVTGPPADYDNPHFYVNGGRVFRDEGHPEGPSSVPWYVVKAGRVYPSEGGPGLRIFVATPAYLFAMKCLAMRDFRLLHAK